MARAGVQVLGRRPHGRRRRSRKRITQAMQPNPKAGVGYRFYGGDSVPLTREWKIRILKEIADEKQHDADMASAAARDQAMKRSLMIYGIDIPDDMTGPEQRLDLDWYFFQVMQLPGPRLQLSDLAAQSWQSFNSADNGSDSEEEAGYQAAQENKKRVLSKSFKFWGVDRDVSPRWAARRKIQSLNMYDDDNGVALIWPLLFFYLITCLTYCGSHGAPSYSVVAPQGL